LPNNNGQPDNIAAAIADISERLTKLVQDEIELAKAEMTQKLASLRAGIVGIAIAAVFALLAVPFLLMTIAWSINDAIGNDWVGFLVILVILVLGIVGGAFIAWRKLKVGAPTPTMAIEEAKKIQATITAKPGPSA
jgi:uncharacterized membrane protein YqjE